MLRLMDGKISASQLKVTSVFRVPVIVSRIGNIEEQEVLRPRTFWSSIIVQCNRLYDFDI